MIQQKIYFSEASYKKMFEDGYLGTANIIFEKTLHKEEIFDIGKQSHFYIVDEGLKQRIDKAIEIIDLIKPELWNISNAMTYKLIDIKNILKGSDSNENNN